MNNPKYTNNLEKASALRPIKSAGKTSIAVGPTGKDLMNISSPVIASSFYL